MNRRRPAAAIALAAIFVFSIFYGSCGEDESAPRARAAKITSRSQLIGGPNALGDVGDYLLENDRIRLIVQDKTFNRGAGVFGGSLIDADIVHATDKGSVLGGSGNDTFGELFPAFFLEMIDPDHVEVIADGSDGGAAIVEVRGRGGEFVTMLRYLNQLMVGSYAEPSKVVQDVIKQQPPNSDGRPSIEFSTRYILEPGARHVRIESTMRNVSLRTIQLPDSSITTLLASFGLAGLNNLRIPTGHVLGFGKLSKVFLPGIGYDLRFGLQEAYDTPVPLPGFPGFLTPIVASTNTTGVNYGFATVHDPESNFVYQRDQEGELYGGRAEPDDLLYLFNASGFGGVFSSQAPAALAPSFCEGDDPEKACADHFADCNSEDCAQLVEQCVTKFDACVAANEDAASSWTFTNYFMVGDGDVASIMEEYYRIRGIETHTVRGRVHDEVTGAAVGRHESVLFYRDASSDCRDATVFNQVHTNSDGYFELELPAGEYCYRTKSEGRPLGDPVRLTVDGDGTFIRAVARSAARIVARITNAAGDPMPAKLTVVGTHEYRDDLPHRKFLMDLRAGEPWRATDLIPDDPDDPSTRQYIEDTAVAGGDGVIELSVRPGKYTLYVSRGTEYELFSREAELSPGQTFRFGTALRRVVDTSGYMSGDFHMHAAGSIDSGLDYNVRIKTIAAEGVDTVVSTDHNFVSDYAPYILRNDLTPWIKSIVGLELTTFESGHFNAFPLSRDLKSMNRGSVAWQEVPPQRIFDELRSLAPNGENIIQVNHPRMPIMGYFGQYNVDPFDSTVSLPFGQDLTSALISPNGPAFVRTVETADGKTTYETTFSWDFDAIEIFNGPHLEELRHFRMPFDKHADPSAEDALPAATFQSFIETTTAELDDAEINDSVAAYLSETTGEEVTAEDVAAMSDADRQAAIEDWVRSTIPEKNTVLCDGNDVLQPGGLDDWYNLLNYPRPDGTYRRYTATGNSDSHGAHLDEPGFPRNYFWVGHDNVERVRDQDLVDALKGRHNIITNGPFVTMSIDGEPVGSELRADGATVDLEVVIRAADWVGADRFRIIANGEVVKGLSPAQSDDFWAWIPIPQDDLNEDGEFRVTYQVPVERDTWFVVEVESDKNLFPVKSPQDIPPFNFDDVIGNLASAFGFGGGVEGLEPEHVFPVTGFAFTNPIWVVRDSAGDDDGVFTPPSPPVMRCEDGEYVGVGGLVDLEAWRKAANGRLKSGKLPFETSTPVFMQRPKGEMRDVRVLFESFGAHGH